MGMRRIPAEHCGAVIYLLTVWPSIAFCRRRKCQCGMEGTSFLTAYCWQGFLWPPLSSLPKLLGSLGGGGGGLRFHLEKEQAYLDCLLLLG